MFSVIKSGMDTALQELSIISNNISNANSTGFKKSSVAFSELFNGSTAEGVKSSLVGKGVHADDALEPSRVHSKKWVVLSIRL